MPAGSGLPRGRSVADRLQDGVAIEKYKAKGVTFHTLDAADIVAARPKAVEAWRAAAGDNPLAKKMFESQVAFMKALGIIA